MLSYSSAQIAQIISGLPINNLDQAAFYSSVSASSKEVSESFVFVAIKGAKADGHDFLKDAAQRGALLVVSEASKLEGTPGIVVADTRLALSRLASAFNDHPSELMRVVGVTGTNGKTTTQWLIYHLLYTLGKGVVRLGTLGNEIRIKDFVKGSEGGLTTPDALEIHALLATALQQGATFGVMEVSSHALSQARVEDVSFEVAVFTNLTRDHLDYHQDMEQYFQAKAHLFNIMANNSRKQKTAVINMRGEYGMRMLALAKTKGLRTITYSEDGDANIRIGKFTQNISGMQVNLIIDSKDFCFQTPLIGHHNIENICAAIGSCMALDIELDRIIEALAVLPQVPGRLESVGNSEIGVYVDYAHTPDALERVLRTLRPVVKNRLWTVFGCGGDRDRGKRPQMGEVAGRLSDKVVVTSDNPRTEDPQRIIADILAGGLKPEIVEVDRRAAIERTLRMAEPGDVVLVAGKGHEDYQIVGTEKQPFSDVKEVKRALNRF